MLIAFSPSRANTAKVGKIWLMCLLELGLRLHVTLSLYQEFIDMECHCDNVTERLSASAEKSIGFRIDFGGMSASKIDPKSRLTSRGRFSKKPCFPVRKNNDFQGSGGPSWE